MTQAELLASTRLRFADTVRQSTAQRHRVLLRAAGGTTRLVLTPAQAAILAERFAQPSTVPEALARLLGAHDCPPLDEYYELVLQAHAAGVLVTDPAPADRSLARQWPLRAPVRAAGLLAHVALAASAVLVAIPAWQAPAGWIDWVAGWLLACALLSAGEALGACALAGGGEVRDPRWRWWTPLPHLRFDSAEAAMGGRRCELAVAALRALPVVLGAAVIAWQHPGWLAPVLAGVFYVLAPWSGTPAAQWLEARYGEHRFSVGTGFMFEPRRKDSWAQWRAWWEGLTPAAVVHWPVWVVLLGAVFTRLLPGPAATLLVWIGPAGHLNVLVSVGIYSLVAAVAVAGFALIRAAFVHWRLRHTLKRPLRADGARGAAGAVLPDDPMEALRQMALFQGLPAEDLAALAAAMAPVRIGKRDLVFREDDLGDAFYVVLEGELEILKRQPAPSARTKTIGWLGPGGGFGEIALLEGTVRTATVRASRASRLLRLAKNDFDRLVVGRVGAARVREVLQYAAFLGRLVFLAGWPFEVLVRYAQGCRSVRFPAGATVLKRGEANIWFYLIYDGAFEAREGPLVLRRMQPGDYFGEISLLGHAEATADVVAIEDSRCLTLARADFLSFFARDFRIGMRMEALAAERLGARIFASR